MPPILLTASESAPANESRSVAVAHRRTSIKSLKNLFPGLDLQPGPGAHHRPLDLGAVANDAGVVHQCSDRFSVEAGNLLGIEIGEGGAEGVALVQDRDPRKAGLEPVEDQFLE